jgi:hypothetical protein
MYMREMGQMAVQGAAVVTPPAPTASATPSATPGARPPPDPATMQRWLSDPVLRVRPKPCETSSSGDSESLAQDILNDPEVAGMMVRRFVTHALSQLRRVPQEKLQRDPSLIQQCVPRASCCVAVDARARSLAGSARTRGYGR